MVDLCCSHEITLADDKSIMYVRNGSHLCGWTLPDELSFFKDFEISEYYVDSGILKIEFNPFVQIQITNEGCQFVFTVNGAKLVSNLTKVVDKHV